MSAKEKSEIIALVAGSELPCGRALAQLGLPRSTYYRWCRAWTEVPYVPFSSKIHGLWKLPPTCINDLSIFLLYHAIQHGSGKPHGGLEI